MVTNPQGAATREGPLHFFYVGGRYDDDFVRTADGHEYEAKRALGTAFTDVALVQIRHEKNEKFQRN